MSFVLFIGFNHLSTSCPSFAHIIKGCCATAALQFHPTTINYIHISGHHVKNPLSYGIIYQFDKDVFRT